MIGDTKMLATIFAKKLRVRRAELKKIRATETLNYRRLVVNWRAALGMWIVNNASRLASDMSAERRYLPLDTIGAPGMPQPPKLPGGEAVIRRIDAVLRRLAITGQKYVTVRDDELEAIFGKETEE